jgi:urate oxidase
VAIVLGDNQYGKAETRLVHVDRAGGRHRITDLSVTTTLAGDLAAAHLTGDNAHVLPTDSQKNAVFALARDGVGEIEDFALRLARYFVDSQPAVHRARVGIEQYGWDRIGLPGGPAPHSFVRAAGTRTATATYDGDTAWVVSGVTDLVVLNTTGSSFAGYVKDRYTTLPEAADRILATALDARWRHAAAPAAGIANPRDARGVGAPTGSIATGSAAESAAGTGRRGTRGAGTLAEGAAAGGTAPAAATGKAGPGGIAAWFAEAGVPVLQEDPEGAAVGIAEAEVEAGVPVLQEDPEGAAVGVAEVGAGAAGGWAESHRAVVAHLLRAFAETESRSLQQTLYAMGEQVLAHRAELAEIRLSLPNKHHFMVDLAPFGLDNPGTVFHAADRPYGLIEGTVVRDGAPPAGLAWW